MKTSQRIGIVLALSGLLAGNAWADRYGYPYDYRHHHNDIRFGFYVGTPWPYGAYGPYPYPLYSPRVYAPPVAPVVIATPPPIYVEQSATLPPAPAATPAVPVLEPGYWYYCKESQAYYPYVKQCSGSWQKVAPQPQQQ